MMYQSVKPIRTVANIGTAVGLVFLAISFFVSHSMGYQQMVVVIAIGIWMVIVAIQTILLPRRNVWQWLWLISSGLITAYAGTFTVLGLAGLIYGSFMYEPGDERTGYAAMGFFLFLFVWIVPIAATYITGVFFRWLSR